jgi:hypothetical protein
VLRFLDTGVLQDSVQKPRTNIRLGMRMSSAHGKMAESVGFVPVDGATLNDLGLISIARNSKNTQNPGVQVQNRYSELRVGNPPACRVIHLLWQPIPFGHVREYITGRSDLEWS